MSSMQSARYRERRNVVSSLIGFIDYSKHRLYRTSEVCSTAMLDRPHAQRYQKSDEQAILRSLCAVIEYQNSSRDTRKCFLVFPPQVSYSTYVYNISRQL